MKFPVIAIALLVSAAPALAVKQPSAKQWPIIDEYADAANRCIHSYPDDGERTSPEVVKICTKVDRLRKKLKAQGFCLYATAGIGRPGRRWTQKEWERTGGQGSVWPKGSRHCYAIRYPAHR